MGTRGRDRKVGITGPDSETRVWSAVGGAPLRWRPAMVRGSVRGTPSSGNSPGAAAGSDTGASSYDTEVTLHGSCSFGPSAATPPSKQRVNWSMAERTCEESAHRPLFMSLKGERAERRAPVDEDDASFGMSSNAATRSILKSPTHHGEEHFKRANGNSTPAGRIPRAMNKLPPASQHGVIKRSSDHWVAATGVIHLVEWEGSNSEDWVTESALLSRHDGRVAVSYRRELCGSNPRAPQGTKVGHGAPFPHLPMHAARSVATSRLDYDQALAVLHKKLGSAPGAAQLVPSPAN
jgi:hypothetical protein